MDLGLVGLPSDPSVRVDVHAFEDSCGPGFGALVLIHGNLKGTKDASFYFDNQLVNLYNLSIGCQNKNLANRIDCCRNHGNPIQSCKQSSGTMQTYTGLLPVAELIPKAKTCLVKMVGKCTMIVKRLL